MNTLSYNALTDQFGQDLAYFLLVEIERAAGIAPKHNDINTNARLKRALLAQKAPTSAPLAMAA